MFSFNKSLTNNLECLEKKPLIPRIPDPLKPEKKLLFSLINPPESVKPSMDSNVNVGGESKEADDLTDVAGAEKDNNEKVRRNKNNKIDDKEKNKNDKNVLKVIDKKSKNKVISTYLMLRSCLLYTSPSPRDS